MNRVNIGCGMTPTNGWHNYDNSFSVKLSSFPIFSKILHRLKLISELQLRYISFCQQSNIKWADARKKIPLPNNSMDVLYSSRMIERLDKGEANDFLKEAKRVLKSGGIIRIVASDLEKQVIAYTNNRDADLFVETAIMCDPRPRTVSDRIRILVVGPRHPQWRYDSKSLCKLLSNNGFIDAKAFSAGDTRIPNPASLDLFECADDSIYVEAIKSKILSRNFPNDSSQVEDGRRSGLNRTGFAGGSNS